jgi:hypothetical protein
LKLSIGFPAGPGLNSLNVKNAETAPYAPYEDALARSTGDFSPPRVETPKGTMTGKRRSDTI